MKALVLFTVLLSSCVSGTRDNEILERYHELDKRLAVIEYRVTGQSLVPRQRQ